MNFIYDIVSMFTPVGLSGSALDVYLGVGCLAFSVFLFYLFYKIVRIFI